MSAHGERSLRKRSRGRCIDLRQEVVAGIVVGSEDDGGGETAMAGCVNAIPMRIL